MKLSEAKADLDIQGNKIKKKLNYNKWQNL